MDIITNPAKPLPVTDLAGISTIDIAIFECLHPSLYRLLVGVGGETYYVAEGEHSLTARDKPALEKYLAGKKVNVAFIKHSSAYDEMIGHDYPKANNALLVPTVVNSTEL